LDDWDEDEESGGGDGGGDGGGGGGKNDDNNGDDDSDDSSLGIQYGYTSETQGQGLEQGLDGTTGVTGVTDVTGVTGMVKEQDLVIDEDEDEVEVEDEGEDMQVGKIVEHVSNQQQPTQQQQPQPPRPQDVKNNNNNNNNEDEDDEDDDDKSPVDHKIALHQNDKVSGPVQLLSGRTVSTGHISGSVYEQNNGAVTVTKLREYFDLSVLDLGQGLGPGQDRKSSPSSSSPSSSIALADVKTLANYLKWKVL